MNQIRSITHNISHACPPTRDNTYVWGSWWFVVMFLSDEAFEFCAHVREDECSHCMALLSLSSYLRAVIMSMMYPVDQRGVLLFSELAILRTQLANENYIFSMMRTEGQVFMWLSSTILFCHEGYDLIPRNVAARNVWPRVTLCICLHNNTEGMSGTGLSVAGN